MSKLNPLYGPKRKNLTPDLTRDIYPPGGKGGGLEIGRYSPAIGLPSGVKPNIDSLVEQIVENTHINVAAQIIERGIIGRNLIIHTTPIRIIDGRFQRGYIILNPSTGTQGALTSSGTALISGQRAALSTGNTQGSPLGVANFKEIVLFLDISATGGGTVTIDVQSQDPVSQNWVTTQSNIFAAPSAIGTYYANLGTMGVDSSFAINFTVGAGGTSTFSIGFTLKDGLTGSPGGVSNTVYLGGPDVTISTGLPLLDGQKENFWARPNSTLWAISSVVAGTPLSVFELQ